MNFDELDNSATDRDPGHLVDPDSLEQRQRPLSQEASGHPSIPSDPEWVSPFTLPPLPALRKPRRQSHLLKSPEQRLHDRNTSGAYYAAAWGSPYATPSPNRSPPNSTSGRRSQDIETASPLSSRLAENAPSDQRSRDDSSTSITAASKLLPTRKRASSWDRQKSLSERFNWLSESDLSGNEADAKAGKTPTKDTYLKSLKASRDKVNGLEKRTHQLRESTATITPETFHAEGEDLKDQAKQPESSQAKMEPVLDDAQDAQLSSGSVDKPLPSLPPTNITEKKSEIVPGTASPDSPTRPRIQQVQSFQRPKKKVVWKGKTCIIALPLTDRESAGLPPLLSSDEVKERMQKWVSDGYDVDKLTTEDLQGSTVHFGQSRSLYPDPQEMFAERKNGKLHVHIPDQGEWESWVEYLKEEKLRALGVTPSNSEPPMSVQSPFSSTLSRVSSAFPSVAASPPIGPPSANGNPIRIANNTFSPPLGFNNQGGMSSRGSSHVPSPSISGFSGPMHGYKQSVSQPRMTSPFDYPVSHPGSFGQGMRNPNSAFGMRQFSPSAAPNLQSFGQILSPMVPTVPSNDNGRGPSANPTMEQIRQQQQRQQQLHQQMMMHQRQQSYVPPMSKSADQLPRTPVLQSPTRQTPEIMHPTPRSHRHNLSAALQKGIDDAEAARGMKGPAEENVDREKEPVQETVAEETVEEDQEPELPVLKRPETLPEADDKSEIETNPSIAASPMLIDDKNPFSAPMPNLQQIKEVLQPQNQSQHKPNVSLSKLNVKAPEFDPSSGFTGSNFNFGGNTFQPKSTADQKPLVGGVRPSFTPKNLSISKLNVEAPTFTPSFMAPSVSAKDSTPVKNTPAKESIATPSKSSFTFSSPAFNVEAPEFTPSNPISFNVSAVSAPVENVASFTSAGSIFGNVVVDANSKVTRRGTKALPIVRPSSAEPAEDDSAEPADDEEGRVGAPSDRQKRARRTGEDDEETLLFADSAPFDHAEGLSAKAEKSDSEAIIESENQVEAVKEPEIVSPIVQNSESQEPEEIKDTVSEEIIHREATPTKSSGDIEDDVVEPKTAENSEALDEQQNSSAKTSVTLNTDEPPAQEEAMAVATMPEPASATSEKSHQSKFSFSAMAKPFEFRPAIPEPQPQPAAIAAKPASESKTSRGLMASRFAAPPSPEPEAPAMVNRNKSPPQEMYEYIKPEDVNLDQPPSTHDLPNGQVLTPKLPNIKFEPTPELMRSIEESMRSTQRDVNEARSPSEISRIDEPMPSYEEIDAVMKQFENDPDLGVEREDSPIKSTPLVDMHLPPTFRSDAPSPSPRRPLLSPQRRADFGLGIHKLNEGHEEVSDWNDEFSPQQEHKLQSQAHYFDGRVNNLVDGIMDNRLGPLEHTLQNIQQSLALIVSKPKPAVRRSMSTDKRESDADDEDDYDAFEGFSSYRSRSPGRGQRKADKIRAVVMDALAAYQAPILEQPAIDMSEIHATLQEMKNLSLETRQKQVPEQMDLRTIMEDVIANHPRLRSPANQDDHEAIQETNKLKTNVLESSLKDAERRADEEATLRQQIENDMQQLNRKLLEAQEEAASRREASEDAEANLVAFVKEKEAHHELKSQYDGLLKKNTALEDTLNEYRVTSDDFRNEIKLERARNQDLIRMMHNLRQDFNDKIESHQTLRSQMQHLQHRMAQVLEDVHADEDQWKRKEQELLIQNKTAQAVLDHEIRHREKIELELDNLDREHKENIRFRNQHERAQQEVVQLQEQVDSLKSENKSQQDDLFKLEREMSYLRDTTEGEVTKATARLGAELDAARATIESLQSDAAAQIARLQKRLDDAELDLEDQKAKYDSVMTETSEAHGQALHEAAQKRENDLEEQHRSHEKKLNDLRERHTRALHNSSDDRHRLENQLNEKLAIHEERTTHLQSQVKDLEERLEITKSAARAAVEAATAKGHNNLPTPASSVVASPPQRLASASLQLMKGSDVPEKISPQALRESIMVLQDQLQNREQKIEQLEAEVAAFDKDAPAKVKERENEISLLQELLSVRVDDLNEIIATLSRPDFDQEATKNAAIRLKANLQMEQQLKERAASIGALTSSLPSMSTISNFAQSPRGIPMAAAAAWGNWRKARDFSLNAVTDIATNISQTPSKSGAGSPSSFLAGIMTPPSTSQRTPPQSESNPLSPPTMRPLAAAAAAARKPGRPAPEARPLRIHSQQARTLSSRQAEKRRESNDSASDMGPSQSQNLPETPTTPTLSGRSMRSLDLGEDVDEDASPLDASDHRPDGPDDSESAG